MVMKFLFAGNPKGQTFEVGLNIYRTCYHVNWQWWLEPSRHNKTNKIILPENRDLVA